MPYTWEEVMLGVDVAGEAKREKKEAEDIDAKMKEEGDMAALWGFGLSILGAAIGGPAGMLVGKKIGEWGADWFYDWETDTISPGKFNEDDRIQFNKDIKDAAKEQTTTQMVNTLVDLGTMYVQSGGKTSAPGEWDPTTFGSGADEWTVFGRGDAGTLATTGAEVSTIAPGPGGAFRQVDVTPVIPGIDPSEDYVRGVIDLGGIGEGFGNMGKGIGNVGKELSAFGKNLAQAWRTSMANRDLEGKWDLSKISPVEKLTNN